MGGEKELHRFFIFRADIIKVWRSRARGRSFFIFPLFPFEGLIEEGKYDERQDGGGA